jgi:hypothetical protein
LLDVLHYPDEAGRAAYLAGLSGHHAAQSLIFERTGKETQNTPRRAQPVQRLAKDDPRFNIELRQFLAQTYDLKAVADYEVGPSSAVPLDRAEAAIATATRLVECIAELLA